MSLDPVVVGEFIIANRKLIERTKVPPQVLRQLLLIAERPHHVKKFLECVAEWKVA